MEHEMTPLPIRQEGPSDLSEARRRVAGVVHRTLDDLRLEAADGSVPDTMLELFVVLDRDDPIALAHAGLDVLATELSDTFGQMRLTRPTAYNSGVMLSAQVVAPGSEAVRAAIEGALVLTMREFLGPDVQPSTAVRPLGEQSRETAVMQIFFPTGIDLEVFASGFSTRDYFRWQVELGSLPGVGLVTTEPCSVLGADVPMGDLLPPNLMISFAVVGDFATTVRGVLRDLERRMGDSVRPVEIVVGMSVSIEGSTPESVQAEIDRQGARGYPLLDHDEEALTHPMASTDLLFEFPVELTHVGAVPGEPQGWFNPDP
jgi:hypothetical protein